MEQKTNQNNLEEKNLIAKKIRMERKLPFKVSIHAMIEIALVQLRLKQASMRWRVEGANYMLILRCFYESEHWN